MLERNSAILRAAGHRRIGLAAVAAASLLLASCAGGGTGGALGGLFGGGSGSGPATTADGRDLNKEYGPDFFAKQGYCPPVQIRPGTEALATYEKGHEGDPTFIKTQASLKTTARECSMAADTMTIKVGIAGRVVGGPLGKPDMVNIPIRIAVTKQSDGTALFSQLYASKVALTAPTLTADFSQVMDQVTFKIAPGDRDLVVFVGFDDKP